MKKGWPYILLGFGVFSLLLSIWMIGYQQAGSSERIITYVNIIVGVILIVTGLLLSLRERRNNKDSYDEKGV
jgi:cytochrome c biogenesis protein CcdA